MAEEARDREALIALTSDVVAAHVSNNSVSIDQVPTLITTVFKTLATLGRSPQRELASREPAVSVRGSVRPDHVTCLECGRKMKMLKRHLTADHGLTTEEYRQRWGLAPDHPLVAPNYADRRRDLAKAIGLGRGGRGGRGLLKAAAAAAAAEAGGTATKKGGAKPAGRPKNSRAKNGARFTEVAAGSIA